MRKLKTTDIGGFPFELDDLRWIESGVDDSFKGLTQSFAKNDAGDFILSGCALTVGALGANSLTYDITEGFIVIDGEICFVESAIGVVVADPSFVAWYFDIDTTGFDASGNETFENAVAHDTYQKRFAKIVGGGAVPSGRVSFTQTASKTIESKIATMIENETFNFARFIKFGSGSSTITSANCALSDKNFINLDFDGTVAEIKSGSTIASGKIGTVVLAKMNATGVPQTIQINHDDPSTTAGRARFFNRNRLNTVVKHGDLILMIFDGTYWNVITTDPKRALSIDGSVINWTMGANGVLLPGFADVRYNIHDDRFLDITMQIEFSVAGGTMPSMSYRIPNLWASPNPDILISIEDVAGTTRSIGRIKVTNSGADLLFTFYFDNSFVPTAFPISAQYKIRTAFSTIVY